MKWLEFTDGDLTDGPKTRYDIDLDTKCYRQTWNSTGLASRQNSWASTSWLDLIWGILLTLQCLCHSGGEVQGEFEGVFSRPLDLGRCGRTLLGGTFEVPRQRIAIGSSPLLEPPRRNTVGGHPSSLDTKHTDQHHRMTETSTTGHSYLDFVAAITTAKPPDDGIRSACYVEQTYSCEW